jgi:hypothetical protein
LKRFDQTESQRTNHTSSRNCHARWRICPLLLAGFRHFQTLKLTLDFYCFLKGSILQVTAKRETEARKLVDCQLSLFNGDLKSDKRKQLPGCVFLE